MPSPPRLRSADGQSAVELVTMLPVVVLLAAALWQVVWVSGAAARAAARAAAVGGDAKEAARRALPGALERDLRVDTDDDGKAKVRIAVPLVVGGGRLTTVTAQARFAPQGG